MSKVDLVHKVFGLPDNVWGFFEWTSGALRLNISYDEFFSKSLSDDERQTLEETINHEMYHCYQILTTGYLHYHTLHLFASAMRVSVDFIYQFFEQKDILDVYTHIIDNKIHFKEDFKKHYEKLDIENSEGVSSRDIIEGAAFLFQKKVTNQNLSINQYLRKLSFAPSEEYSKAFLYSLQKMDDNSFELFQLISYLSLSFFNPQKVFPIICEKFKGKNLNSISEKLIREIILGLSSVDLYLGSSWDVVKKYAGGKTSIVYEDSLNTISKIAHQKYSSNFYKLMISPEQWHDEYYKLIDRPLIFNPDNFTMFVNKHINDDERKIANKLLAIIAGFNLLIAKEDETGPRFLKMKKY